MIQNIISDQLNKTPCFYLTSSNMLSWTRDLPYPQNKTYSTLIWLIVILKVVSLSLKKVFLRPKRFRFFPVAKNNM